LRPQQSKGAEETAFLLTDIFLTFGAPCILHSDNGREFVNSVITEICTLWPDLKIVYNKPRHSQSQGSVERANHDIQNMLASWMKDNHTTNWSNGLRFAQFMKNRAFYSGIKQSPYKAMFGIEPRVGMTTSTLPSEVVQNIEDEDELEEVIEQINAQQEQTENGEEEEEVVAGTSLRVYSARKEAHENLNKQAKRMKMISDAKHPPVDVGRNVILSIPDVDRANSDFRNLVGVVKCINVG
jgi:hypothetical protein